MNKDVKLEDLPEEVRQQVEQAQQDILDQSTDPNPAPKLNPIKTRRRDQLKRELRIPNLDQLSVFEPPEFVISIPDPSNSELEWDIVVQELTPGQYSLLNNTAFSRNAEKARAKLEELDIDPDDDSDENLERMRKYTEDNDFQQNLADFESYRIEVCLLGIVEPKGLTRDDIEKWSSNTISYVYNAIINGAEALDAVDAFPGENPGSINGIGSGGSSSGM